MSGYLRSGGVELFVLAQLHVCLLLDYGIISRHHGIGRVEGWLRAKKSAFRNSTIILSACQLYR